MKEIVSADMRLVQKRSQFEPVFFLFVLFLFFSFFVLFPAQFSFKFYFYVLLFIGPRVLMKERGYEAGADAQLV
jgi:hypothetical protein